jgi:hypothetical protein
MLSNCISFFICIKIFLLLFCAGLSVTVVFVRQATLPCHFCMGSFLVNNLTIGFVIGMFTKNFTLHFILLYSLKNNFTYFKIPHGDRGALCEWIK